MQNSIHSSTGESHFILLHGRDMKLPFHCTLEKRRGPYRIIEIKSPVTYKIKNFMDAKEQTVHINRLKPFKADIPEETGRTQFERQEPAREDLK